MLPVGMHEVTSSANTVTKTDHNAQLVGETRPIGASENRESSHSTSTDTTTYRYRREEETRPTYVVKRLNRRKKVAEFFSRAIHNLREAFVNYVSPARDGTPFLRNELQTREIADVLYNDPGPWHEYGMLNSDVEDDRYYKPHDPTKKRPRKWFQTRSDRNVARNQAPSSL